MFYRYCSTITVPPSLFHYHSSTLTFPPVLFHHHCSTLTVLRSLFHHYCSTFSLPLSVPPLLFHHHCYHHSSTINVPPLVFHHLCSTITVPPSVFHWWSVPSMLHLIFSTGSLLMFHHYCSTITVFYLSCKRWLSFAWFPWVLLHFLAYQRLPLELQCCTPSVRVMFFNTWLLNSLSQINSCCMYFAEMVLSKPSSAFTLSLLLSSMVKI